MNEIEKYRAKGIKERCKGFYYTQLRSIVIGAFCKKNPTSIVAVLSFFLFALMPLFELYNFYCYLLIAVLFLGFVCSMLILDFYFLDKDEVILAVFETQRTLFIWGIGGKRAGKGLLDSITSEQTELLKKYAEEKGKTVKCLAVSEKLAQSYIKVFGFKRASDKSLSLIWDPTERRES